jgi:CheY-like chemotaxis protein
MGIIDPLQMATGDTPHVLVVDDDTDVREMLEMFLGHSGFTITSASNGIEALEKMREQAPCLVLLDLMMPVMSGWQFRERQLQDPRLASVPVVCITAAYDPQTVQKRLGLPCLQKPVDLEELVGIVHRACRAAGTS